MAGLLHALRGADRSFGTYPEMVSTEVLRSNSAFSAGEIKRGWRRSNMFSCQQATSWILVDSRDPTE